MLTRIVIPIIVQATVLAVPAGAGAAGNPDRTTRKAEQYLKAGLPAWADVNLSVAKSKWVSCSNGCDSDHETRIGRHPAERVGRDGRRRYRSFDCDLHVSVVDGVDADGFELTHTEDLAWSRATGPGAQRPSVDRVTTVGRRSADQIGMGKHDSEEKRGQRPIESMGVLGVAAVGEPSAQAVSFEHCGNSETMYAGQVKLTDVLAEHTGCKKAERFARTYTKKSDRAPAS